MARKVKVRQTKVIDGVQIELRVVFDTEWQEYTSQVQVAGSGVWTGTYHTDDEQDAINTMQAEAIKLAAIQRIATI